MSTLLESRELQRKSSVAPVPATPSRTRSPEYAEKISRLTCAFYKNPFIKDKYGIGDRAIDDAIMPSSGLIDQTNLNRRAKFKRYVLPEMMKLYKAKYFEYSSLNGVISVIVYLSDYYRQFKEYHMSAQFNPALIEINRLIESENQVKSNKNKGSNMDRVVTDMNGMENLYFEKNSALKAKYRELLSFLSSKYYGVFREYASFLYNYYLVQANALKKYRDLIMNVGNSNSDEQRVKNAYIELMKIFPSEVMEAIPSQISEGRGEKPEDTPHGQPIQAQQESSAAQSRSSYPKMIEMKRIIDKRDDYLKSYGKEGIQKSCTDEETKYMGILRAFDEVLKSEKQEERSFKSFQKARALLYGKMKELGGGVEDKKFLSIRKQFDDSYSEYIKAVRERITKYDALNKEIKKQSGGAVSNQSSIFKSIEWKSSTDGTTFFDNDMGIESTYKKGNSPTEIKMVEAYNLLRKDAEKIKSGDNKEIVIVGMDDDAINMARVERLRVVEKFLIQIENNAKGELEEMERKLAEFKLMKKDAEDEYSIVEGQKKSMNENRASKEADLKSYKEDRTALERKYETIVDRLNRAEEALATLLRENPDIVDEKTVEGKSFDQWFGNLEQIDRDAIGRSGTRLEKLKGAFKRLPLLVGHIGAIKDEKDRIQNEIEELKNKINEIESGPRYITAITLAKKAYLGRFPILLSTFEGIIAKKVSYNTEINAMVSPFIELTEEIYQSLTKREAIRMKLDKKRDIQSSIYEAFISDPLYKLIKSVPSLITTIKTANSKEKKEIQALAGQQLMRSINSYVQLRNANFSKAGAIINTSEIDSKKHVLQSMIEMMKGVKIGSFAVPVNANSKKIVDRMSPKDVDEVSILLSNISSGRVNAKNQSIQNFPVKYGKYFAKNQPQSQTGGANVNTSSSPVPAPAIPPPAAKSAVAIASSNAALSGNKARANIFGNGNGNAKNPSNQPVLFMEMIYQMILTQGEERVNMEVNKIKETEQDILQMAAIYINAVKYTFNGTGREKIKDHLDIIMKMCKEVTVELDKKLVTLMKQITTTAELFNIRLISEYIFMEVILVYLIVYFK